MRFQFILPLVGIAAVLVTSQNLTASDNRHPSQAAMSSTAKGLILEQSEGERRVRRGQDAINA